jgi:hypothetical protein
MYFLVVLVAAQLLAAMPLVGPLFAAIPWYVRSLGLPAAVALLFGLIRVEGRNFHLAAWALGRFALRRRGSRLRREPRIWRPSELHFLPDGSDPDMRGLRYTGPGMLVVRASHRRQVRRATLWRRRRRADPSTELVLTPEPGPCVPPVAIEVTGRGRVRSRGLPRAGR